MVNKYSIELIIYYIVILALSTTMTILCNEHQIHLKQGTPDTAIATMTAGSFGALFFLMALPRTGFLRKVEHNGTLFYYSLIFGFPAFLGTMQLAFSSISLESNPALFLFFLTVTSFIISIIFICLILYRHSGNASKNNIRGSMKRIRQ